ncbi:MAG TPA: NAD(P)-dependent methylenetetrahydromethanopterin dehydrogenase [Gemmatimonadaceae bacterium]|nr:NAD(P)-dependent methylenetetrahydromethanopterin dehydrogenase [Gemmatimonadaceae bacterium]
MKKLLLHLDSSSLASVFDRVVAYDGGADDVLSYAGVRDEDVRDLVHGTIFTRGPKDLHNTAIFIGGTDMSAGQELLGAVQATFFGPMRVSVMLDSNGSNTTAVAAVARLAQAAGDLRGRRAVVVAGTGPVGTRAAGLLARAGANVAITSRHADEAERVAEQIRDRFGGSVEALVVRDPSQLASALGGAELLLNAGPAGVALVPRAAWADVRSLRAVADLNAVPPLGIEGVDVTDSGADRNGVKVFGALGVGNLKMKIHKRGIAKLFERNDLVLDAESIGELARDVLQSTPAPPSVPPPG